MLNMMLALKYCFLLSTYLHTESAKHWQQQTDAQMGWTIQGAETHTSVSVSSGIASKHESAQCMACVIT